MQTIVLSLLAVVAMLGSVANASAHEAGNVTDLKLTLEQFQYSQLRFDLAKAEAELREHREKLNRLPGVWGGDTGWKLAASTRTGCGSL